MPKQGGSLKVSETSFTGNSKDPMGSWGSNRCAIAATDFSRVHIKNSIFVNNSALYGSAISCEV